MDPFTALILGGSGMLGNIFGNLSAGNEREWLMSALVNVLNNQRQGQATGLNYFNSVFDPLRQSLLGPMEQGQDYFWNSPGGLPSVAEGASDWQNQIQQLFRDSGTFWTPQQEQAQGGLFDLLGQAGPIGGTAGQLFMGGGWNPLSTRAQDLGFGMATGQGWEMGVGPDVGGSILGNRGQTAFTEFLPRFGQTLMSAGGMTPGLENLSSMSSQTMGGLFGVGGLTPTGAVGEGVGLEGLLQGGATPYTENLQAYGAGQAMQEPLLPLETVLSMSRSEAGRAIKAQVENMMRQTLARGGGPGAISMAGMSGPQTMGMMSFADQAAEIEAKAVRDALIGQQGLQLQRQQQGMGMAGQAGALESQRLGQFGNLLTGLEGVASGRFGTGANLASDAQRLALGNMDLGLQSGLGGLQAELGRMGLGGDLLNQYNQTRLGALGTTGNLINNQLQYGLGGGQLYNQLLGTQAGIGGNIFDQMIASGNLGRQRAGDIGSLTNQIFGTRATLANTGLNAMTSPWDIMSRLAGTTGGFYTGALGNEAGLFGQPQTGPNPWANFGSTMLQNIPRTS